MVLLVLLLVTSCAALPQDLSGKMFIFPEETNTANVKMTLGAQNINAVTVCLRFFTDLSRSHSPFSLATTQYDNHFLIYPIPAANVIRLYVSNKWIQFEGLNSELNKWHSVCATWDGATGLGQLWFDGKNTVKKFFGGSKINQPIIVLGQDQDTYGNTFDSVQSFVGMMSEVHMWDYTLSACEIQRYVDDLNFTPGNVLNWRALTFQITGRVLIENKEVVCNYSCTKKN